MFSQIGIGTVTPNASSILDVTAADKGVLIPRVSLTGTGDITTIANPIESLLVYNTSTVNDVIPAFYYWNGTSWVTLITSSNVPEPTNVWNLNGNSLNAIANDGTAFLGTTSAKDLFFKVNNNQIGRLSVSSGIGFGLGSVATANQSIAIGTNASSNQDAIAIGYGASNSNFESIAIGRNASATYRNLAIGYNASCAANNTIAIGTDAFVLNDNAIAIGLNPRPTGNNSIGIGSNTTSSGDNSIAIGNGASAQGQSSLAIGDFAIANGLNATAIGYQAVANQTNTLILGNNSKVGIGTSTPAATLDVVGQPADNTVLDGMIPPRITGNQLQAKTYTAAQDGAILFVTAAATTPSGQTINVTQKGIYSFSSNSNRWELMVAL